MRLHVIDGTYELFRAHYSKRSDHVSPGGQDLKATLGLATTTSSWGASIICGIRPMPYIC